MVWFHQRCVGFGSEEGVFDASDCLDDGKFDGTLVGGQ